MPPEINFGQPQNLSHTTESPWEQAALMENSGDLRNKSGVSTNYDVGAGPNFCSLVSSKSRWLTNALSWPIVPVRWSSSAESRRWNVFCARCSAAELPG